MCIYWSGLSQLIAANIIFMFNLFVTHHFLTRAELNSYRQYSLVSSVQSYMLFLAHFWLCCFRSNYCFPFSSLYLIASLIFTRLDAFCVLQDLCQFKHQLTPVPLIKMSNRYTLSFFILFAFFIISSFLWCIFAFVLVIQLT